MKLIIRLLGNKGTHVTLASSCCSNFSNLSSRSSIPCIASSIDTNQLAHAPKNNPKTIHQALQKQVIKILKAYGLFYDRVSAKTNQNKSHD